MALVAYEGGLSGTWFMAPAADQPMLVAFIQQVLADPRMADVYRQMANDFAAAGGTILSPFDDVGSFSIWRPWGAVPDLFTATPRMEALKAANDNQPVAVNDDEPMAVAR